MLILAHGAQWSDAEKAQLAKAYADGGIRAARVALPHRHERALYMMADKMGVRSPHARPRTKRKYDTDERIDDAIRRYYQTCENRPVVGRMAAFARSLNRPVWWVRRRAAALGMALPADKTPNWSDAEVALLEANAHKSIPVIRRIFKKHGFYRTESSIGLKLKRGDFDRESPNHFTAGALAKLLGVDPHTVGRWIARDGLPAKRRDTNRTEEQGGDMWVITRAHLRTWIADHPQLVDLRKVDRYWFIDLAFGRAW